MESLFDWHYVNTQQTVITFCNITKKEQETLAYKKQTIRIVQ